MMDMGTIFQYIADFLGAVLSWIVDRLPDSPFLALENSVIADWLPYINYFLPFDFIIDVLALWLVAVSGYYAYFVIMRAFKIIS